MSQNPGSRRRWVSQSDGWTAFFGLIAFWVQGLWPLITDRFKEAHFSPCDDSKPRAS